jgi:hypothetical protein
LLRAVYFILAIGLFVFERAVSSNAWFDGEWENLNSFIPLLG